MKTMRVAACERLRRDLTAWPGRKTLVEKTKGHETKSRGPSFNMVRLQEWHLRLKMLIQIRIASDKDPIHPQTYPHTPRDL